MSVMNKGDQVYRLGNDIETDNKIVWMNHFFKNNEQGGKFWMIKHKIIQNKYI